MRILHGKTAEGTCTLCSAVAYCCGAVAPRAIAALLGRFLPRLGPLVHSSGPFFFWGARHFGMREARTSDVQAHRGIQRFRIRSLCMRAGMTALKIYSAAAWN